MKPNRFPIAIAAFAALFLSTSLNAATVYRTLDAAGGGLVESAGEVPGGAPGPRSVSLVPMTGWPKSVGVPSGYKPQGVTLTDLNNDDTLEVVAGGPDGYIYVWDMHGNAMPGWPKNLGYRVHAKVAVGDLHGDGEKFIVAATANGLVHVYRANGDTVPGWPQDANGMGGLIAPTLSDLDGDDSLEVLMPQAQFRQPGHVYVWTCHGELRQGWPQNTDYIAPATVSVADVDDDDAPDVCASSYNSLYLWDRDGNALPGWPVLLDSGQSYAQPTLYDLDGDGQLEVAHTHYNGDSHLTIFSNDGTAYPGWPRSIEAGSAYMCPAAGGLLSDSVLSYFLGAHLLAPWPGFHSWNQDGVVMTGWPVDPDLLECTPVTFDLAGDYQRAVLIGNNTDPGKLYAYHADGTPVPGFPFDIQDAAMVNGPSVADVDLDGQPEVALVVKDGTVNLWKVDGVEYHPWLTDYGTMFHDNWHTGWFHPQPPEGLTAQHADQDVLLHWHANPEPDIAGYHLYRTTTPGQDYVRLNGALLQDTTFTDTTAGGDTTFYYAIAAVIRSEKHGRLSVEEPFNPSGVAEGGKTKALPRVPTVLRAPDLARLDVRVLDIQGRDVTAGREFLPPGVYFVGRPSVIGWETSPVSVSKVILQR
jgi:hypothetical protein